MKKKQLNKEHLRSKFLIVFKMLPSPFIEHFKSFLLITGFILLGNLNSNAQSYPKIHQDWTFVTEDEKRSIEFSYQVVQCTSTSSDSIFLNIFNEKPTADTFQIDVVIYNEGNTDSTTVNFKIEARGGEMMLHNCGSGDGLRWAIVVPSGYKPSKLTVVPKIKD